MKDSERITAVLVDTCAFRKANTDFIGVNSKRLPLFFEAINSKEIDLLTHPILENEIKNQIEKSSLCTDFRKLVKGIEDCQAVLEYADLYDQELFRKIKCYDIIDQTYVAFKKRYDSAIKLGYSNPEIIFDQYFSAKPPFSVSGNKKNEFPDAFVIESAKNYMNEHINDALLVVSEDNDWKKAFADIDRVTICESIDEALGKINRIKSILSEEMQRKIFDQVYKEMESAALACAEAESYELNDYSFELVDDLVIDSIQILDIDNVFIPYMISRNSILFKSSVKMNIIWLWGGI